MRQSTSSLSSILSVFFLISLHGTTSFAGPVAGQWMVTLESHAPSSFNSETGLTDSFQDLGALTALEFIPRDDGSAMAPANADELKLAIDGGANLILSFRSLRPWPLSDNGTRIIQHNFANELKTDLEKHAGHYQFIILKEAIGADGKVSSEKVKIKNYDTDQTLRIDQFMNALSPNPVYMP